MNRERFENLLGSLVRFGKVVSSKLGASKSVEVGVEADGVSTGPSDNELWSHACFSYKPATGTECLFIQLGDERVTFATKDRNHQITVANGEVVIRALGSANAAYVLLKPTGEVLIKSTAVKIGADTAAQAMVLGNNLKTSLDALTVPTAMGPSGTPINAATFVNFLSTKHDVDS